MARKESVGEEKGAKKIGRIMSWIPNEVGDI